jgi:hypothetical protein
MIRLAGILLLFLPSLLWAENIRFVVLRHADEAIAHNDALSALKVVKEAKGLSIKSIGNTLYPSWTNEGALKRWLMKKVDQDRENGDLLILHTIGHGFPDGSLMRMGQRREVLRVIEEVAVLKKQKILWWQLSCFATAGLPAASHQELVTVLASSPAGNPSSIQKQDKIMADLFKKIKDVDENEDGYISVGEFRTFLNSWDVLPRGDLLFNDKPERRLFQCHKRTKKVTSPLE